MASGAWQSSRRHMKRSDPNLFYNFFTIKIFSTATTRFLYFSWIRLLSNSHSLFFCFRKIFHAGMKKCLSSFRYVSGRIRLFSAGRRETAFTPAEGSLVTAGGLEPQRENPFQPRPQDLRQLGVLV